MGPDLGDTPMIVAANKSDLPVVEESKREHGKNRLDRAGKVRKTWRASHLDCSAKHNWNISLVFRELAMQVLSGKEGLGPVPGEEEQACCQQWIRNRFH